MGGQIPGGPIPVANAEGDNQFNLGWGWTTPAQRFGMTAMRYLRDTGCSTRAFAEIAVAHRYHASLNPKAIHRSPITIEDHQRSRWVVKPFRLLDCCQETDVSAAIIVTSRERALRPAPSSGLHHGWLRADDDRNPTVELLAPGAPLRRRQLRMEARIRHGGHQPQRCRFRLMLRRVHLHHADPARGQRLLRSRRSGRIRQRRDGSRSITNCRAIYRAGIFPKGIRTAFRW